MNISIGLGLSKRCSNDPLHVCSFLPVDTVTIIKLVALYRRKSLYVEVVFVGKSHTCTTNCQTH